MLSSCGQQVLACPKDKEGNWGMQCLYSQWCSWRKRQEKFPYFLFFLKRNLPLFFTFIIILTFPRIWQKEVENRPFNQSFILQAALKAQPRVFALSQHPRASPGMGPCLSGIWEGKWGKPQQLLPTHGSVERDPPSQMDAIRGRQQRKYSTGAVGALWKCQMLLFPTLPVPVSWIIVVFPCVQPLLGVKETLG